VAQSRGQEARVAGVESSSPEERSFFGSSAVVAGMQQQWVVSAQAMRQVVLPVALSRGNE